MYSYIKGAAAFTDENSVTLDVSGVGYKIFATSRFISNVVLDSEVRLFVKLIVREDDMSLYGFESMEEKTMFERLTSVSGVGSKSAMAILSQLTVQDIAGAVMSGDADAFSRAPGIGKKTAQRLLLELKGKVTPDMLVGGAQSQRDAAGEAAEALMGLGYTRSEAVAAVSAVRSLGDTAEELTLLALKRISR